MNPPNTAAFPVTKLAPTLRALADPEGKGDLSAEQAFSRPPHPPGTACFAVGYIEYTSGVSKLRTVALAERSSP